MAETAIVSPLPVARRDTVDIRRRVRAAKIVQRRESHSVVSSIARRATDSTRVRACQPHVLVFLRVFVIVLYVTRSGLGQLRSAIRTHVEREGLRPLSVRTGIPVGQIRSLMQGRAALSTTLERVSSALGLEFYIGPPRKDSARAGRGYEGRTVRERPASDEEAAPAWAMKLQRELRASLREDLAQVLRELTDAKRDTTHPQPPAAGSPGGVQ